VFDLCEILPDLESVLSEVYVRRREVIEAAEIQMKYAGYIEREKLIASKADRLENLKIPDSINYNELKSLTFEAREKLSKIRPETIAQASRIPGVSPSDVSVLLIKMGR